MSISIHSVGDETSGGKYYMTEGEWKAAFITAMEAHGGSAFNMAEEEADYQWMNAPNVEEIDPIALANKIAPAYLR
ncbi:hypothetical protein ACFFU8_09340 [Chromobacterium piscinae]|uniref:hypothetical protein n=1 Tax=Chromobacterium piscinae TaxID=686831 RepID=UPI001E4D735D|nr:hypothetical protein [Chromobacterium piscinae]MCD5327892.1 hypothetical protein [Chromobacterium piscinae]